MALRYGLLCGGSSGGAGHPSNIVDDTPATVRDLDACIAEIGNAPRPLVLPGRLLNLVAPYGGMVLSDVSMVVSNAKVTRELGWSPRYPSHRDLRGSGPCPTESCLFTTAHGKGWTSRASAAKMH
jgi:nucleoside-diphosphate-sugar epimerase